MQKTKQLSQSKRSPKKLTTKFSSNNNISDIIKRFETKKVNGISLNSKNENPQAEITNKSSKNDKCLMNSKENRNCIEPKQIEHDHGNMNDLECFVDGSENIANDGKLIQIEQTECNDEITETCNKFRYESRTLRIRQQLQVFQRIIYLLLNLPFFSSINGAGLSTLICAFFLPRFLCQSILYPIFRLVFGTLYPAYASYKAVRNKDNKDYVSKNYFIHFN